MTAGDTKTFLLAFISAQIRDGGDSAYGYVHQNRGSLQNPCGHGSKNGCGRHHDLSSRSAIRRSSCGNGEPATHHQSPGLGYY
jgi:hypothetical protein